jgi:predicted PurR-regulated permease PerM
MNDSKKFISIAKYFLLAACLVLLVKYSEEILSGLRNIGNVAAPLVLGLAIGYILNILMKKLEKIYFPKSNNQIIKESRRIVCIFLSILIIIGIIGIVALIVIPEFVTAVSVIVAAIPSALENVKNFIITNSDKYEVVEKALATLQIDIDSILGNVMTVASSILTSILNSTLSLVGSFTSGLMNFVIAMVFAIYLLISKEKLLMQIKKIMKAFLKSKTIKKINYVFHVTNDAFSNFIVGQCMEAVIIGLLCTIGMLIFRFPYAVTVGAFISATALIPVVGAYLGAALGVFMMLTVSPIKALLFFIFITILQQLENNLIYPRVVGSSIGLPGIWVFASIIIGGGLGGIVGILFSVPITASIYRLFSDKVHNRLRNEADIT